MTGQTDTGPLTVAEFARQVGISTSKAYELIQEGAVTHHRVGRKIVLDPADVAIYWDQCRVAARPPGEEESPPPPGPLEPRRRRQRRALGERAEPEWMRHLR